MKTLTLDYLPVSVRRKDGWLITLIKRKFYANFSNLEHGNIIFIDGDFTLQCGNSDEPAATVDVHDDRFYTTPLLAVRWVLQRHIFKACGPAINLRCLFKCYFATPPYCVG